MATIAGVTVDTTRWTTVFQGDKTNYMVAARKLFLEQDVDENGNCKLKDLAILHAAYVKAVLMANQKEWENTVDDYKTIYNYETIKNCLACKGINFDTILTSVLP